ISHIEQISPGHVAVARRCGARPQRATSPRQPRPATPRRDTPRQGAPPRPWLRGQARLLLFEGIVQNQGGTMAGERAVAEALHLDSTASIHEIGVFPPPPPDPDRVDGMLDATLDTAGETTSGGLTAELIAMI